LSKFFKKLYYQTDIVFFLFHHLIKLINVFKYNQVSDKKFIEAVFFKNFGYAISLDKPVTFNEKINWINLNNNDRNKEICTDKLAVREYVNDTIGEQYLIPLLFQTKKPSDIVEANLPDFPLIIKTNHGSGDHFIIRNKKQANYSDIQYQLRYKLKINYYHNLRESQYKNIVPHIIVEKLLMDADGNIPKDFKIYCFNSVAKFVRVGTALSEDDSHAFYNSNWDLLDITYGSGAKADKIDKPDKLSEMLFLAQKLSEPFDFVRVDLYNVGDQIYFGELTFTPGGGTAKFNSLEIDRQFGELLKLNVN
jgi:hypothetical protein